jgi:predicted RNase H-like nuclease
MAWIAGVDGCAFGWFAVLHDSVTGAWRCFPRKTFAEILNLSENPEFIAVDIPIGLADGAIRGGRTCDDLARKTLGQPRGRSVFSSPARSALAHVKNYTAASRANRESSKHEISLSKQAFAIMPKIKEVDDSMSPELQGRVYEVHPELCFYELNGQRPIAHGKKSEEGATKRRRLLEGAGFRKFLESNVENLCAKFALDDLLDASVACWTARRIMEKTAIPVPEDPPLDAKLLRMQMWR